MKEFTDYEINVCCTTDNLTSFLKIKNSIANINRVKVLYFKNVSFYLWRIFGIKIKDQYLSFSMLNYLLWNAKKYSLVHIHIPLSFLGFFGSLVCNIHKIPYLYHIRGCYSEGRLAEIGIFKKIWVRLVEKFICKHACRVIALTNEEKRQIYNVQPKSKISILPNGLDPKPFRNVLEGNFESPFVQPYILFLGRLDKAKGLDYLLNSFANIAGEVSFNLVIAGPDEGKYELAVFESKRLNSLLQQGRIKLLGPVSGTYKLLLIRYAKGFFLPSIGEGLSMAILESLFLGCPVFATSECNIPEAFKNDAAIEISRDIYKIEESLLYLQSNQENITIIGSRGREFARKFEIKNITKQYISIVENIVRNKRD